MTVAIGATAALLVEWTLGGWSIAGLVLHVGMLGYVLWMIAFVPSLHPELRDPWTSLRHLATGLTMADVPSMVVRTSAPGDAAAPSVLLLGAGLAAVGALLAALEPSGRPVPAGPSRRVALGILTLAALVIVVSQGWNRLLLHQNIPNEERSFLLAGHETHHLNFGFVFLPVAALVFLRFGSRIWAGRVAFALSGLGLGLILDQWLYYMLHDVSDEAYFSFLVVGSAAVGVVFLAWWTLCSSRATRRR